MSANLIVNNSLMNQPYLNGDLMTKMLYIQKINQMNQQYQINQMNMGFNPYQYYQKLQYNNCQNNFLMRKSFLYEQNMTKYTQLNTNYFPNNKTYIQNNNYHKGKKYKNRRNVFNKYERESILKNNEDEYYYEKSNKKEYNECLSVDSTEYSNNSNKEKNINEKLILENEKETSNEKNNKEEKKEDEDFYLINEETIPNSRRFSQRSKRSNDSDNSNCSYSTSHTLNETLKNASKNDVSENKNDISAKNVEKTEYKGNPAFENTEILNVKVKIGENKFAYFKLKRFDDIFMTIQYFCEINNLDEKMIKPLIIKSLCAINTIYQVMNSKLNTENMEVLKEVKNKC